MKALVLKGKPFVTHATGKRVGVRFEMKTYDRLCEAEAELADVRAYEAVRPNNAAELAAGQFSTLAEYRAKRSGQGE